VTKLCGRIELAQAIEDCGPAKVRTTSASDTGISEDRGMAYDVGFFGAILTDRGGSIMRRFEEVAGCSKFACKLNF
jgi:hypothetical protein